MDFSTVPTFLNEQIAQISFSWYDYTLFVFMISLSISIGIYFGCFGSHQATVNEYLLGSKELKVFPISVSLVASHISGITLLAIPAEVYRFGGNSFWTLLVCPIAGFITAYVFLPVYYKLQITSIYEYLERRFDARVRLMASVIFTIAVLLYIPIVIYIPALALSSATGMNVHYITPVLCGVCIFYTTIGGLKAVVWTDTLQFIVTSGAVFAVFILGVRSTGGFSYIMETAYKGHRLDLWDFSFNICKRDSAFIMITGIGVTFISNTGANQGSIQKLLALPTLKKAQRATLFYSFGLLLITGFSLFSGLIMYAKYVKCDPFSIGIVNRNDQLLPYYVMDVAGGIPGLTGLFMAGVFCAALSTLSAALNCVAGTLYEDCVSKFLHRETNMKSSSGIIKLLVVIVGIICTGLVYAIEHMGGIFPLSQSFQGVTGGPTLALFLMGMTIPRVNKKYISSSKSFGIFPLSQSFQGVTGGPTLASFLMGMTIPRVNKKYISSSKSFGIFPLSQSFQGVTGGPTLALFLMGMTIPRVNKKAAFYGPIIGITFGSIIVCGAQYYTMQGMIRHVPKPFLNTGCPFSANLTTLGTVNVMSETPEPTEPFMIFRISSYCFGLAAFVVTLVSSILISCFTEKDEQPVEKDVLSPFFHFLLPKNDSSPEYYTVEKALDITTHNLENEETTGL